MVESLRRLIPPSRSRVWLVAAAIAVIGAALANAFILPLTQPRLELSSAAAAARSVPLWSWTSALAPLVPESPRTLRGTVLAVAVIGALALVVGSITVWRMPATRRRTGLVAGTAIVAWFVMTVGLPTIDSDIFSYIADGRVYAAHGANPEVVAPIAFPDDPILPFTSPEYRGIAGDNKLPLWTDATAVLARVAGDDPISGLLVYRGMFLAASILNLGLIWLILKRTQPDLVLAGLVLYGWNPITLATGVSKVDTLMATFALSSLALLTTRRLRGAAAALALSVLVKLITLPVLAVRILSSVWRRDVRGLAADLGVTFVVVVVAYLPFWAGPGEIAAHLALLGGGASPVPHVLRPLVDLGLVVLVVVAGRIDDGTTHRAALAWSLVLLYFGALLTTIGLSWYLITMIAVTAVAGDGLVAAAAIALSFVSLVFDRVDRYELGLGLQLPVWFLYLAAGLVVVALVGFALARRSRPFALR